MEKPLNWDIFCRVVDNFGDIGVCWRLSHDLAQRGHGVRLWVDDPSALQWMAPLGHPRIQIMSWTGDLHEVSEADAWTTDVIVEGFGCGPDPHFLAGLESHQLAQGLAGATTTDSSHPCPVWINLEYLSAESYVEKSHALASHSVEYPTLGGNKFFFYPGFTPATGGLIREPWLGRIDDQATDAVLDAILNAPGPALQPDTQSGPQPTTKKVMRISLFCYENAPIVWLWRQLLALCEAPGVSAVQLLVTSGKASELVRQWLEHIQLAPRPELGRLVITFLPLLTQAQYDQLLRQCDLNFVRGEDSLVRAIWAKRPFIWHIYPQEGGHHGPKLQAFLEQLEIPLDWANCMLEWNAITPPASANNQNALQKEAIESWTKAAHGIAQRLSQQDDLVTQLVQFVGEKR